MDDKCWFCLQVVEKGKWREHMDTVHRAVNREMPVENNSIPIEPLVMLKIAEVEEKYNELIMAVAKKFTNETRHETALRYIKEAEKLEDNTPCKT